MGGIAIPVFGSTPYTADPKESLCGQAEVEAGKSSACSAILIPHGPAAQASQLEQLSPLCSPHYNLLFL